MWVVVVSGIEVKPGKPFTHKPGDSNGRLHISMVKLSINLVLPVLCLCKFEHFIDDSSDRNLNRILVI